MSMTVVEAFDAPMIDFNEDNDVPMAGSSTDNWFQQSLSNMEEDPVEVDMMIYNETAEYEMGDEAIADTGLGATTDVASVDAEVYDLAIHSLPVPSEPELVIRPDDDITSVSPLVLNERVQTQEHAISTVSESIPTFVQHDVNDTSESQYQEKPPDADIGHDSYTDHVGASETVQAAHVSEQVPEHETEAALFAQATDVTNNDGPSSRVNAADDDGHALGNSEQATESEQHDGQHAPSRSHSLAPSTHDNGVAAGEQSKSTAKYDFAEQEDNAVGVEAVSDTAEDGYDHTGEHAYIEPPPPISLTLRLTSSEGDQPEFALFSAPEATSVEDSSTSTEEPLVLLQHHPSLFYEPITAVFEAFRQEEYFTHIEELSEAEMVLDAHDLQLVISEDSIYSREVSLHDLYAMHQGINLPGHLRLTLQSIVPRFIARYNHLRDQITRLAITDEAKDDHQQPQASANEKESAHQEAAVTVEDEEDAQGEEDEGDDDTRLEHPNLNNSEETHGGGPDDNQAKGKQQEEATGTTEEDDGSANGVADETELEQSASVSQQEVIRSHAASSLKPHDQLDEKSDTDEGQVESFSEPATGELSARKAEDHHITTAEQHDEPEVGSVTVESEHVLVGTEPFAIAGEDEEDATAEDEELLLNGSHPISVSVSQESYETEDSEEADALWEAVDDDTREGEDALYDDDAPGYEGDKVETVRFTEEDADNFEGEDFEASTEDTLEDFREEAPGDAEAASEAVLRDSEKFVNDLAGEEFDSTTESSIEPGPLKGSKGDETGSNAPGDLAIRHKTSAKRSLRDADLEDGDDESPLSSPGSKRTKMH